MRLHWYRSGVCEEEEEAAEAIYKRRDGMLPQNIMIGAKQCGKENKTR